MTWIFRIIPFPLLLLLAGLIAGAAAAAHVYYETQKANARDAGVPTAISASELGEIRGFPWFDEVAVRVQTHEDLTFVYWEDSSQGEIEFPIVFFFDPAHSGPVREVIGAIAFDSFEAEEMAAYLDSVRLEDGPMGPVFELVGIPPIMPYVTREEVEWAASDLGVTLAPNFLYLDPHFKGRDQRLAARPELTLIAGGASMFLIWLALIAFVIKRRWNAAGAADSAAMKKGFVAAASGGAGMMMSEE